MNKFQISKKDVIFLKTYPFFHKYEIFQLSLVIREFSTQMYFARTNVRPWRLNMYKTDSFISADEVKEIECRKSKRGFALKKEA